LLRRGKSQPLKAFVAEAFAFGLDWRAHVIPSGEFMRPSDINVSAGCPDRAHRALEWKRKCKCRKSCGCSQARRSKLQGAKIVNSVSYAQDFHGSFERNLTREVLTRLFGGLSHGVYLRIGRDGPRLSPAIEWLREAKWLASPGSDEVTEGDLHLLLVELSNHDACQEARLVEVAAVRRPWFVVLEAANFELPELERQLGTFGYSFIWFDGTYRYFPAFDWVGVAELALAEPLPLEKLMPPYIFSDARIAMTLRCRDCDAIPKVANAGRVIVDPAVGRVQVMHNGIRVLADGYGGAWTTRLIELCRGHHEPQEERIFHEVVSQLPVDASMIEIGGYWAYYSLWFLSGGNRRRSIVVEPDPAHLEIGRRNATLNGLSPEFLAGSIGRAPSAPHSFQTESSGLVNLPCLSVPQILVERGFDRLDLLHCDAQGAELAVLESCRGLLRCGAIRWVFISTHAYQISGDPLTHQRCLALMLGLGGKLVAEYEVHESFSGDGLIVAWFGSGQPELRLPHITRNRYSESMFRNPLYEIAANTEATRARAEAVAALSEVKALRESTSWRVTAPLRLVSSVLRRGPR
jgi:FkbM family methyltransferase